MAVISNKLRNFVAAMCQSLKEKLTGNYYKQTMDNK